MKNKRIAFFMIIFFVASCFFVFADDKDVFSEADTIINDFRDKLYEQELSAKELVSIYAHAASDLETLLKKDNLCEYYSYVARNEYFLGRAYQYENKKDQAAEHYELGISYADKSLNIKTTVLGLLMKAECVSQSCAVRSTAYAMANGLSVGDLASQALKLDPANSAALYLQAARYIYAPGFFANQEKGRDMLYSIIELNENTMASDDAFNVYSAMGYSFIESKKNTLAISWLKKALSIYPTNKYVASLLAKIE